MEDNDHHSYADWQQPSYPSEKEAYAKLRKPNQWRRHRLLIIPVVSIMLVMLIIYSVLITFYLLSNRQVNNIVTPTPTLVPTSQNNNIFPTQSPVITPMPSLSAIVATPQSLQSSDLTATTKNYQFICIDDCDLKLDVVLSNIMIDTVGKTMAWNFTITNHGSICSSMGGSLSMVPPSGSNYALNANGGTFLDRISINTDQSLPRTATFSDIPQPNTQYTVTLSMYCGYSSSTYQSEIFAS